MATDPSSAGLHAIAVKIAAAEASGQPSGPTPLPLGYEPRSQDICCGRGKRNWTHSGNVWFRNLIQANVDRYMQAPSKTDKTAVVISVVEQVRGEGAFFVKQDEDSGRWYDIGDTQAREKVGHSLRDQVTAQKRKEKEGDSTSPPRSPTPQQQITQNFLIAEQSQLASLQTNAAVAHHLLNQQTAANMMPPQMVFSLPQTAMVGMNSIGVSSELSQNIDFLYANGQPYNSLRSQPMQPHQGQQLHSTELQDLQPTPIHPQLQHQFRNMYQQPPQSNTNQKLVPPPQNPDYGYGEVDYYNDQTRKIRDDNDLMDRRRSSRESVEVLEKFGRRPSWRAMSISSTSAKGLVNDIQDLQAEFGDDIFDDYVFDRRRSSIQPFSFPTGALESRRMSAISMGSNMGDSFGDLDNTANVQFNNNFRSSIRRSSVTWMKEVQQQLQEFDKQHATETMNPSTGGYGRRASAFDMLKILQDMDYHDDD